jgi:hypothetical protein
MTTRAFQNGQMLALGAPQCGRLMFLSATALKLAPYNGALIKINGSLFAIPSGGIAGLANTGVVVNGAAGQNLAAATVYYVYAFINAGIVTADFSTAGHAASSTSGNLGVEVKAGDDTRTLIGMVRTNASAQFADSPAQRFVLSWFNRRNRQATNNVDGATITSQAMVEVNPSRRVEYLSWSDEDCLHLGSGTADNTAANAGAAGTLGIDGSPLAIPNGDFFSNDNPIASGRNTLGWTWSDSPAEGYHFDSFYGRVLDATGTAVFSTARWQVLIRG